MAKDLEGIHIEYQGVIDTLLAQKAAFETRFEERMAEINAAIGSSENIKNLSIARDIRVYTDWITQMLINNTQIIKHQQQYIIAILESIDMREDDFEDYEAKISELEDMNETLRKKLTMVEMRKSNEPAVRESPAATDEAGVGADLKYCIDCLKVKPKSEFGEVSRGRYKGSLLKSCKVCSENNRAYQRERYNRLKETGGEPKVQDGS